MTAFAPDARPLLTDVTTVPGPTGDLVFSTPASHRRIGAGWSTWSHGYTGDVYFTNGATSITMTMPAETSAFYFYAEPDTQSVFNFTATAQDGTTSGSIGVDGLGGAKYFGFYGVNDMRIETITVSSTDAFAVGEFGICKFEPPPVPQLTELSDVHAWVSLRNSDEQGTQFDLMAELLKNGTPVATGLTRCVAGVTRDPETAREVVVPWDPFAPVPVVSGDVLELRLSTRVGTTPEGAKCDGPAASHYGAAGIRVYYDSSDRPTRFDATITPAANTNLYLHSDGSTCVHAESHYVTFRSLDGTAPSAPAPKCKDSYPVNYAAGNEWSVIGVWSRAPQP